ncbi:hypothetical protein, partial [Methylomonas koyamae]|uniref:hypothetical protein n=1 Tax=Methylomonas koyamae TaxID=702114 RepID=UPI0012F6F668
MINISLDLGKVPSVLEALSDQRLTQQLSNAAAETYVTSVLDYIRDGHSFKSRHGAAGLEGSINWQSNHDGSARAIVKSG